MIPDFKSMIQTARRDDDYINASAWCKQYGKRITNYLRTKETKAFLKSLSEVKTLRCESLVLKPEQGVKGDTWVHPLVSINLAQWLSSDFAVVVADVFKSYLEADPELAKDIINRQTDIAKVEDIEATAKARSKYLRTYRPLMDAVKDAGGDQHTYMNIQKLNNKAITGKTTAELKVAHGVKNARDAFDPQELTELSVLQSWQSKVVDETTNKYDAYAAAKELAVAFETIKVRYLKQA